MPRASYGTAYVEWFEKNFGIWDLKIEVYLTEVKFENIFAESANELKEF